MPTQVPTQDQIIALLIGPFGAIVALCVAIYFLWKLFREEQKENRANFKTVTTLADVIKDLKDELRIWRQAALKGDDDVQSST